MTINSTLETVLYATDPRTTASFYTGLLGLRALGEPSELSAALRVSRSHVLLIFNPEMSGRPGRDLPSHGAVGPGHVAFRVDDLGMWRERLLAAGVEIEHEQVWGPPPEDESHTPPTADATKPIVGNFRRGRSIYLRDPAGNSVELIDADIWPE